MTAFGSKETAIEAMRHGAVDYLEKPFDVEEMRLSSGTPFGQKRLADENRRPQGDASRCNTLRDPRALAPDPARSSSWWRAWPGPRARC